MIEGYLRFKNTATASYVIKILLKLGIIINRRPYHNYKEKEYYCQAANVMKIEKSISFLVYIKVI